jgi:NADH dehydrogenase [ubiquinone] 1 alpha subcomplex assembly factor 7
MRPETLRLKDRLKEIITLEGPLNVADYVTLCLHDPEDGYYAKHVKIGAEGDFITAPMVSQIFGELIGLWCVQVWLDMGSPTRFNLVEIGPGDGTLMSDILRAGRSVPDFIQAAQVVLVEPSLPLRDLQSQKLAGHSYCASLDDLPEDAPILLVANEVLDCLPANQYVRTEAGFFERRIGLDEAGALVLGLAPAQDFMGDAASEADTIYEYSPAQVRFAAALAHKLKTTGGAALLIDYGRDAPGAGDTLQALYRHQKHDPLEAPGGHDLTQWADFPKVAGIAQSLGLGVSPIAPQGEFLMNLGIGARLEALSAKNPDQADKLYRQVLRLIAPDEMGTLFKVLGLSYPPSLALPGLEAAKAEG